MQDVLRETIEKAKKSGVWEKLTQTEQMEVVTKYLQKYFDLHMKPLTTRVPPISRDCSDGGTGEEGGGG